MNLTFDIVSDLLDLICEINDGLISEPSLLDYDTEIITSFNTMNTIFNEATPSDDPFKPFFEKVNDILDDCAVNENGIDSYAVSEWMKVYIKLLSSEMIKIIDKSENEDVLIYEKIIDFYDNNDIDKNLKAVAFLLSSDRLVNTSPKISFKYGTEAFRLDPDVLKYGGIDKRFEVDSIKNEYTEICPVCNSADTVPFKNIVQYSAVSGNKCFQPMKLWMKCNKCTTLFAYNFPVIEMKNINGHYTRSTSDKFITPRNSLEIYDRIFKRCSQFTSGKKYLEIGIGNGEMLAAALECGYDVKAIEICREDCERISAVLDVDIIWADFLDTDLDDKFDIIIMGDVLEHVSRPVEALRKAKSLLNDDGVLWVSTPNYESGFSRLMRNQDPMWNQPNHYTYFSYSGIQKILDELGMKVVNYDISGRYNGSMELCIKIKK